MTRLTPRQRQRAAFLAKWSKVDWSKQNSELADETGLSRERIRQIRQKVGAPRSPHHRQVRKTAKALAWAEDNLNRLKGMFAAEVGRKYGLSPHWRGGPLYEFLKPFLRDGRLIRKHRWDLMNFRLPNSDLERIWRLPYNMVRAYRSRKRCSLPAWCLKRGPGYSRFMRQGPLPAYHRAVKAEERKAARYFARESSRAALR